MHIFYCFLFCSFSILVNAQKPPDLSAYKTQREKLIAWANYCDELLFKQDQARLMIAGKKGLSMTPKNNPGHLSLFNFYIGISFNPATQNDSSIYYLEQSEKFARLYTSQKRIEETLMQLLIAYSAPGKAQKRDKVIAELERRVDTIKDAARKSSMESSLSNYYIDRGEYEKGLKLRIRNIKSMRVSLSKSAHNDSINFGVALVNVAELYLTMKNPEKAIEYLSESTIFIKDYQDGVATIYKDFIDAALMQDKTEAAKKNYTKLAAYLKPGINKYCWHIFIDCDLAFADYYLQKNNNPLALHYLNHARQLAPKYSDAFQIATINHITGKAYLNLKQYDKALPYLEKAAPVTKEDLPEKYSLLQKSLSEAYAATGNWKLAYQHFDIYSRLQDTLLTEKAKNNLAKMEAQYQNKKKQQEITVLSAANKIKNLEIQNAGRQRIFFIIGLVLLFIIIGSLVVIYRNKQKSSLVLEQKNRQMKLLNDNLEKANTTKAKLFSIIGHDLRSPISHIYQFLDLQQSEPELFSEADKKRHNERISDAASSVLETMEDLLIWSKSQMQQFTVSKETINLAACVNAIIGLLQPQIDKKAITVIAEIPHSLALVSDRNILTILIRNILQNALKFSPEKSTVSIKAIAEQDRILLSIADEGSGIPLALRHIFEADAVQINSAQSGLGLTLVKEMAELLDANISLADHHPKGTIITVVILQQPML